MSSNNTNPRKTFAIISHPDAGKTTLTEKLLLFGGAIQQAGAVKARGENRRARSDWMKVEQERGISVASSVMTFDYKDITFNLLDTPGHEDFSEDTYRVLTAVDSAVMVIDSAKGIETQTKKLFEVCRLRNVPIITFINKLDREGMDPFSLLDDIEKTLALDVTPASWPIGMGKDFLGCYDLIGDQLILMNKNGDKSQKNATIETCRGLDDEKLDRLLPAHAVAKLREDIEMVRELCPAFDKELYLAGALTPVFFGSALTNFGVQPFLEHFLQMTTSPLPRVTLDEQVIDPASMPFSAFVFKIQANMNKAHRDRIAFMRICSGKFEKGMEVMHIQGKRKIRLAQPQQFMAQDREIIEEAYAGDVIGVFDPGIFSIGDTLCDPSMKIEFQKIPTFAPEHFARVTQKDTMKRKQFLKGITQIAQEGAIQVFQEINIGMEEIIVGGVGVLQFDVLEQRLKSEYNVEIKLEILPYQCVRWILNEGLDPNTLNLTSESKRVRDLKGRNLIIFANNWGIKWAMEQNKGLELAEVGNAQ